MDAACVDSWHAVRVLHGTGGSSPHSTWAFVSVTNNETQHITVISPH